MRACLVSALALCLFVPPALAQTSSTTETSRGFLRVLVSTIGEWQDLRQQETATKVALAYEENLTFPSLAQIERIDGELANLETELETLQAQYVQLTEDAEQAVFLASIREKQAAIETLQAEREAFEKTYATRQERQQANLVILREDLEDLREGIEKQQKLIKTQFRRSLGNILFVLSLIIVLLVLRLAMRHVIVRFAKNLNDKSRTTLLHINRIGFNILIALVVLGVISSQLMSLLPFVALIGTGLAFAVRDSISSFIAWFLIGTDRGYRIGDILEVGAVYGRVKEIGPFITVVQEMKGDHETGKMVSFANKVLFEKDIANLSRCYQHVKVECSVLLKPNSDTSAAKVLLLEAMQEVLAPDKEAREQILPKLERVCGITPEEAEPSVWLQIEDNGIRLQATFLTSVNRKTETKAQIEALFLRKVKGKKSIVLAGTPAA